MPIEKKDFEEEFENVLLDGEMRIQADDVSEPGDESRCRELDSTTKMYSAIADHNQKIGELENEKLRIEKDSEVRIQEIKSNERVEHVKTGVSVLAGIASFFGSVAVMNHLLEFEKTDSVSSMVGKGFFKDFPKWFKGIRF